MPRTPAPSKTKAKAKPQAKAQPKAKAHREQPTLRTIKRLLASHPTAPALPAASDPVWDWVLPRIEERSRGHAPTVEVLATPDFAHAWLLVLADDQPFLTDTVSMAVHRNGLDILALWHPVVGVDRAHGSLRDASVATAAGRKARETWILMQVSHPSSDLAKALADDVKGSLKLAIAAVRDFPAMRSLLRDLLGEAPKGEQRAFLQWLLDANMILLGYRHYDYSTDKKGLVVQETPGSGLGILAEMASHVHTATHVSEMATSLGLYVQGGDWMVLSKTPDMSRVHRPVTMDYVAILQRDAKGRVVGEHRFIGLYTSSAYSAAVYDIPLVRDKLAAVLRATRWPQESYNSRILMNVLETWPRDELFLTDTKTLTRLCVAAVATRERPDVRVLARTSAREQAASILVYLPIARMSTRIRSTVAALLEEKLASKVLEFKVEMGEGELARMVFRLPWHGAEVDEEALTRDVRALVRGWDDLLQDALAARVGAAEAVQLARRFVPLVDAAYRARTPVEIAADDLLLMEASTERNVRAAVRDGFLHLRLTRKGGGWPLAELMPLVDSCGLRALTEQTFRLGEYRIHDITCALPEVDLTGETLAQLVAVVDACLAGVLEEDSLNELALTAGLGVQEIMRWRAWVAYLQQLDRRMDPRTARQIVRAYPELARAMCGLFDAHHNPALAESRRGKLAKPLQALLEQAVRDMPTAERERVWRCCLSVVNATVRTNAYQPPVMDGTEALAFKVRSARVWGMVEPRPWREIFVYHPTLEGVHLRGGKIARGGLRHSDRATDYRTEILALMVAQMRKNTIIVPVGAKGGFYVRVRRPADRAEDAALVKACYQRYVRALLSMTDTYDAQRNVVRPRNMVCLDKPDPYMVVAADKGTAHFSDTANALAIEADYWDKIKDGYWLGDAFASGGSKGYDHKAMGITARGAWVSVAHHLGALGIEPGKDRPLVMVGIGDMGGDVFGNGLLMDRHAQLIGAFNHIHIFLDPDPDPAKSYAERKRLYDAALGWDAYDAKLISAGGGVFRRSDKSIPLNPRMRMRLGVKAKSLTPDEVIKALLTAPVDVLWNGGIGTYIKASDESHLSAADKANDDVRVDASKVNAKVIGEGGNLGITPRGRVELSLRGILLNTDAMDNSAGVDTSDHEVNLKILLQQAMRKGAIDEKGRVKLLHAMTDDVATLVLRDNSQQNMAISIDAAEDETYQRELCDWQAALIGKGEVDPLVDCLPTLRELQARKVFAYTRPELAALLAGTKAWLRKELQGDPELLRSKAVHPLLMRYFPLPIREQFEALVGQHPLADDIVATVLANMAVNRLGILTVPRLCSDHDATPKNVMRALTVAVIVAGIDGLWHHLDELHGLPFKAELAVHQRLKLVTGVVAAWVLRHGQPVDVGYWLKALEKPIHEIVMLLPKALHGRPEMARWTEEWQALGLPLAMAHRMSLLSPLVVAPDVATLAQGMGGDVATVLAVHLKLGEVLRLPALVRKVRGMVVPDAWTRKAVQSMAQELFDRQRHLSGHLLRTGEEIEAWMDGHGEAYRRYHGMVREVLQERHLSVAMLSVLLGRLRELDSRL